MSITLNLLRMLSSEAIKLAGGVARLAKLLGISRAAIYQWGSHVPALREFQILAKLKEQRADAADSQSPINRVVDELMASGRYDSRQALAGALGITPILLDVICSGVNEPSVEARLRRIHAQCVQPEEANGPA